MLLYFLLVSALIFQSHAFDWHQEVNLFWSEGCDWTGNDLSNHRIQGDQCGPKCASTPGCTHFTWTRYQGGTCWLKQNSVSAENAKSSSEYSVCGYMKAPTGNINWHDESNLFWAENCDWNGNDLTSVQIQGDQCGPKCASTPGCTHFTWKRFNGGTCWLKQNQVSRDGATKSPDYSVCGYLKDQQPGPTPEGPSSCTAGGGWNVLKNFDFSSIDKIRQDWNILTWAPGFVNNEKQRYTTDAKNVFSRNGHLILKAYRDGDNSFSSGRVETKQTYTPFDAPGKKLRVEYTGKVPTVSGAWPAYWILGIDSTYGGWPAEGEIDVMEWVQSISGIYKASLHWLGSGSHKSISRDFSLSSAEMGNNYVTYGVEWSAVPNDEYIQFYMRRGNGQVLSAKKLDRNTWADFACPGGRRLGQFPCSFLAPFDNRMHLIINLAVGGDWGGVGVSDYNAFWGGVEFETSGVTVCQKS